MANAKRAVATINPHNQNLDTVQRLIGQILNMVGCGHCGRLSIVALQFLGDPPPEMQKEGVISLETTGG
jgi:hypothetical protein